MNTTKSERPTIAEIMKRAEKESKDYIQRNFSSDNMSDEKKEALRHVYQDGYIKATKKANVIFERLEELKSDLKRLLYS